MGKLFRKQYTSDGADGVIDQHVAFIKLTDLDAARLSSYSQR